MKALQAMSFFAVSVYVAATASATTLVVAEQHVVSVGPFSAIGNATRLIPQYSGATPLATVATRLDGDFTTDFEITNPRLQDVDIDTGAFSVGWEVSLFNTTGGLLDLIFIEPRADFAPPVFTVPAMTTINLELADSDSQDSGIGLGTLSDFVGNGNLSVDFRALVGAVDSVLGDFPVQRETSTVATAEFTVQYLVLVPEPSSLLLFAIGIVGTFVRRRG